MTSSDSGASGFGTQREPNLVSHTHYCVMGDVTVDASAAISPGVVLQASPGSRIVIAKGACLAGGVCIQSRAGVLTISAGVTLGANVLIVGSGLIGDNACVSPGSTLMNPQIEASGLVPPNSLVGETGPSKREHQVSAASASYQSSYQSVTAYSYSASFDTGSDTGFDTGFDTGNGRGGTAQPSDSLPKNTFVPPGPVAPKPVQIPAIDVNAPPASYDPSKNGVQLNKPFDLGNNNNQSSALTAPSHDRVYGRDQVSQLISTLFPNRESLNGG
ncbi:MAG: hypothetical protein AAGJ69_05610 [Cyanobacteria bacterium J06559_1]